MTRAVASDTIAGLRSQTFELLEAAAHHGLPTADVAGTVDRLRVVANELGAVERLLLCEDPPLPGELRRRRYAARVRYQDC